MAQENKTNSRCLIEYYIPRILREYLKKLYWKIIRFYNRCVHLKKGKFVEFGYRFRFSRIKPYCAYVGDRTIIEEFNVWNAKAGDIKIGSDCWLGLHNIVMGPIEIGNNVATGPHVSFIGPRHAHFDKDERKTGKTIIKNNVWISTGSIILFGVKIGENAIIGPGSVVTKDVSDNAYMSGNPARDLSKMADIVWAKSNKDTY